MHRPVLKDLAGGGGVIGLDGGVAGDAGWGCGFLFFIGPY